MATLRDVRRRIQSVKSTQKLTRAMKMVASSKLRRAEKLLLQARPYAAKITEVVESLAFRTDAKDNPLLNEGSSGKVQMLVVTGDRGLCGGFNSNVLRFAVSSMRNITDKQIDLFVVGKKARDYFLRRPEHNIADEYVNFWRGFSPRDATIVSQKIISSFTESSYDAIYLVYNEFKSALSQKVVIEQLLPIKPRVETVSIDSTEDFAAESASEENGALDTDYLYEPSLAELVDSLLKQHIEFQVHRAFLESYASEQGARMTAMDAATDNAQEMINTLTLQYHRARQASITRELIEIVSGADALSGS
ncbi:MAG: ATP synthase F1 subunit gamma [Candidatus Coatesbacteria bacterium]|nr:ATP synthase F1 subunit gamma [Candidatus Coatesbacteria bacterium]